VTLRVVSYNIRFGGGRRLPLIGRVLADLDPDVVILQEATNRFAVERLAELAGLRHVAANPGVSVAALARTAPSAEQWHAPPGIQAFLEIEPAGSALRLIGLHFPSGLSGRGEDARLRHTDAVLATVGKPADQRTLLVGDLNSIAPGETPIVSDLPFWLRLLLRFDGPIRSDVIPRLTGAGWADAFRSLHPDDPGFSFPTRAPHVRFDYVLAPASVLPQVTRCAPASGEGLARRASDHFPLVAEIDG
jgi:exodeoxyribonuclease-3